MINYKILKRGLIFLMTLIILLICTEARLIKANAEGWVKVNNSWRYYSDSDIKTGWYKSNGNWYYMEEDGSVKTGWIKREEKLSDQIKEDIEEEKQEKTEKKEETKSKKIKTSKKETEEE